MLDQIFKIFAFPVKFHPGSGFILDSHDMMVAEVRGWGQIEKYKDAEKIQDALGEFIASSMNEEWKKATVKSEALRRKP